MAFTHGRHTVIIIDGNNISAFSDNTEENDETDVHDVTTYGSQDCVGKLRYAKVCAL